MRFKYLAPPMSCAVTLGGGFAEGAGCGSSSAL